MIIRLGEMKEIEILEKLEEYENKRECGIKDDFAFLILYRSLVIQRYETD